MDLATATPRQIDERLAALESEWFGHRATAAARMESFHRAAGDRQDYRGRQRVWRRSDSDVLAAVREKVADPDLPPHVFITIGGTEKVARWITSYDEALAAADVLQGRIDELEGEFARRGGWPRFFQLRSTGGARIHGTRWCSGLHRSDQGDLGWHPELSGKTEAEAVAELGPVMCSKCFRTAPVEWRQDPRKLTADPDRCPGSGEVANDLQTRYHTPRGTCPECGKPVTPTGTGRTPAHKKPKAAAGPVTNPDGSPLRVGGETFKTERSAQIRYTDEAAYVEACNEGWYPHRGRYDGASRDAETILVALAHARGTTVEEQRDALAPKVTAKAKGYRQA